MPDFYGVTAAKAQALIKKYGRKITINHVADAVAADPDKPWDTTDAPDGPVTFDTFGVFIAYDSKDVDGDKIKGTDLKLLVSPVGMPFEIANRDTVTDSKHGDLSIQDIDPIEPGDTRVLYTLQVRR